MGKVIKVSLFSGRSFAVDAYAFDGQYLEISIQQGRFFASAVQHRLNKIGIL
jgi:hypothetical protein